MHRTLLGLLVALFALSSVPTLSFAADAAEVLIRRGVDKRRNNDNKGALPLFQEAFEISQKPRAAAQLGLCEQALEMWGEAEAHLSESLVSQTDTWVAAKRKTLETSLRDTRAHMARIVIEKAPDSAMIIINGTARGKPADGPFYVRTGDVEVSIVAGTSHFETVITSLAAGENRMVTFAREPEAKRAVPPPMSHAAQSSPQLPAEFAADIHGTEKSGSGGGSYANLKWISLGVGTAALAVGTYALLARNGAANSFNSESLDGKKVCFKSDGRVTGPDGGDASARCDDLDSTISSMTTVATIGFVTGVSLVAVGVVLWAIDKPKEESASHALVCSPSFQQFGFACAGNF